MATALGCRLIALYDLQETRHELALKEQSISFHLQPQSSSLLLVYLNYASQAEANQIRQVSGAFGASSAKGGAERLLCDEKAIRFVESRLGQLVSHYSRFI
jgi:hypothetical protein